MEKAAARAIFFRPSFSSLGMSLSDAETSEAKEYIALQKRELAVDALREADEA